ncbi:hypothetical protein [Devosia sp.]|uniref:hypothetical protein n=1 Tax=Devosia sp. TaxID=1871048 RepID=UPI002AFF4C7D|nr:hypothetical protein [Devosia sp.]
MTAHIIPFKDTAEAQFRRHVREAIRKTPLLNKSERDFALGIVNLWFVHRNGDGFIHPGAERLAKKARVSLRSAKTYLSRLREMAVIRAVAYAKGGRKATRYVVDLSRLMALFDPHGVVTFEGRLSHISEPPKRRNMGLSSVGSYLRGFVKTVQFLHTVYTSAHQIDFPSSQASDHHPAFPPADDPGPRRSSWEHWPESEFQSLGLLEMAA